MTIFETVPIGPYEFFFLVSVVAGLAIAWASGRRSGEAGPELPALLGLTLTAGIVGARTLHFDPSALQGSKTILGGVLLGSLALFAGRRFLRLTSRSLDALAVALPVGFAIGRVGCLLVGCCFGRPTDLPWGLVYDEHSAAFRAQVGAGLLGGDAVASLPVHATQIYEAVLAIFVAAAVPLLRRRVRREGSLILAVLLLLCVGRMALEYFRARELATFVGLTEVQWLLAGLAVSLGLLLLWRERKTVEEVVPLQSSRVSGIRIACVAAVPVVLLIATGSTFVLIERIALTAAAATSLLALAERMSLPRTRRFRLGWKGMPASLAMIAVVLQQPEVDPAPLPEVEREYPRTDWSVGVSYGEQTDREARIVGQEWDDSLGCGVGGYRDVREEFLLHYRLVGTSVERTVRSRANRSTTIRLIGFAGSEDSTSQAGETTTTTLRGFGSSFTYFERPISLTAGVAVGRFGRTSGGRAMLGATIGSPTGFHIRAGHNDIEPQGGNESTSHVGIGYAFGTSGWAVRGGREYQDHRSFLAATLPIGNILIEPTVFLSEDGGDIAKKTELRITAAYRFPGRVPQP